MALNETAAFERFRRNNKVKNKCLIKNTSSFIENSESSTIIEVSRTHEDLNSVLVFNDTEGPDNLLVYVYKDADFELGDYFIWNDCRFFALYDYHIVKDVDFKKFKALECNIKINNKIWAYFIGSRASFRNTSLENKIFEASSLKPTIIVPICKELKINSYININNQNWRIVDADLDTIKGIGYYYIERDLNSRDLEEEMEEIENNDFNSNVVYVGQEFIVKSKNGNIVSDKNIDIIKRTSEEAVCVCNSPGITTITTSNGDIIYTVKEI